MGKKYGKLARCCQGNPESQVNVFFQGLYHWDGTAEGKGRQVPDSTTFLFRDKLSFCSHGAIVFAANQYETNFYQVLKADCTNRLETFIAQFCKEKMFQKRKDDLETGVFTRDNSQQIRIFIDSMRQLIGLRVNQEFFSFT